MAAEQRDGERSPWKCLAHTWMKLSRLSVQRPSGELFRPRQRKEEASHEPLAAAEVVGRRLLARSAQCCCEPVILFFLWFFIYLKID